MHSIRSRYRRIAAVSATAVLAGLLSAPAAVASGHSGSDRPRRIMENLDRGLVAVPSGRGTFLSWRLLGTEYGSDIAFNVYKGGKRLNRKPVTASTTYQDDSRGGGTYTVRAVVEGREKRAGAPALSFAGGHAEIPLAPVDGDYTVQHAWPGDLDGDGRYELVVSRLATTRDRPDLLEAYSLTGKRLWRVDQGPGSYTQVGGNGANDPAPAAISGSTPIGGYRNDDNVTVHDLDSDGRAEVLVHTAAGTTFADGKKVEADSPARQFVSVVDGETGTERTRRAVPDDFTADGPSGGHFGIAYLDGVHPSLVTKLVTRVGAKRGSFRTLFQTWDFDGRELTERWKYVADPQSGATSFHQIRVVDVDRDGRDEIADGNYVVNSDGTLRYVVDGAGHGDRFHIADLDPDRPGLEGFAIQQSELGVVSAFPWYYYDAGTGERLTTGAHPQNPAGEADLDVGRGTAADIDPRHRGLEYWTSTADVTAPGAGVRSVRDGKVSTTTPSVNFRIWWDGDKGAELLDRTYVEKWDPESETSERIFDPSGVVPGARNATPFYGDILGDWREEILAETADHSALRLYTTTEPTGTRLYTLAHNPAYRLGWTVRGYLQSTFTDYHLGFGSRNPAKPAIRTDTGPDRAWTPIASDSFRSGTGQWRSELQDGGSVTAADGVLDIDVPSGATVWFEQKLKGPYEIEYTATPVSAGGPNDRVSDLNNFWNATDVRSPRDLFATARGGALPEYNHLKTYYVGYGANGNTTTRLRRYVGDPDNRPLLYDYTQPLLTAGEPNHVRIVSDGSKVQWWNNGRTVFDHRDPEAYTSGHFAFRTVTSHFRISDFTVWRPPGRR